MKTDGHSQMSSSPHRGLGLSFPVIGAFLTQCDIGVMDHEDAEAAPEFPNRIRKYRKAKRLNLTETAEQIGISFPTLQRWETKQPWLALSKVARLAEVLECTPYDLLPYHPKPNDPEIQYVIERMKNADNATRMAIMKSVKGLTDRDEATFDTRPPKR